MILGSQHGIYIIEDIGNANLLRFKNHFDGGKYQVDYVNLLRPKLDFEYNNMIVIRQT